jgi:hypothetical protein
MTAPMHSLLLPSWAQPTFASRPGGYPERDREHEHEGERYGVQGAEERAEEPRPSAWQGHDADQQGEQAAARTSRTAGEGRASTERQVSAAPSAPKHAARASKLAWPGATAYTVASLLEFRFSRWLFFGLRLSLYEGDR